MCVYLRMLLFSSAEASLSLNRLSMKYNRPVRVPPKQNIRSCVCQLQSERGGILVFLARPVHADFVRDGSDRFTYRFTN